MATRAARGEDRGDRRATRGGRRARRRRGRAGAGTDGARRPALARAVCGVTKPGNLIVTPVTTRADGSGWFGRARGGTTALLVRGWAPDGWTDADADAGACAKTTSVARGSETKGWFTPANEPEKDRWYWLDAPAIAASRGLPRDTPVVQAIRAEGADATTYPSAPTKEEMMRFPVSPEQHLGYAATWFALSAATGALAVVRIRRGVGYRL